MLGLAWRSPGCISWLFEVPAQSIGSFLWFNNWFFFFSKCCARCNANEGLWSCSKLCPAKPPCSHPCTPSLPSVQASVGCKCGLREPRSVLWCFGLCLVDYLLWSLSPLGIPDFNGKPVGFPLLWLFMGTFPGYLPPNVFHHGSLQHPVVRILLYSQEISWWLLMFLLSCQQNWLLWVGAAQGVKLEASSCYLSINLPHLKATQSIVYSLFRAWSWV